MPDFTYTDYVKQIANLLQLKCKADVHVKLYGLGAYIIQVDFNDGGYQYVFDCDVNTEYYQQYLQTKGLNERKRFHAYEQMVHGMKVELMYYMLKKFFNVVKIYG